MKATELRKNKLAKMFNLQEVKKAIKNCPKDETVILLGHYSINQPKYPDDDAENLQWDFEDLEKYLNCPLIVTDFDDLVADPYGLFFE